MEPALLSDGAVRAVVEREGREVGQSAAHADLAALLRYHATEGREALVEVVTLVLAGTEAMTLPEDWQPEAEAIVTALVGSRP